MGLPAENWRVWPALRRGGIDIIKGRPRLGQSALRLLADVPSVVPQAVRKAAATTGLPFLYAPNVTAPVAEVHARARLAKKAGAEPC